jgi:Glycosyl transferase family 2
MKNPKFTIIIPTTGRIDEFKSTLKTVVSDPFPDLEILIQDNATSWGLFDYVQGLYDSRIVINRESCRLYMADNWHNAINVAKGDYITILGDDDGWYKGGFSMVSSLLDTYGDVDVVTWSRDDYGWPQSVPCIRDTMHISFDNSFNIISGLDIIGKVFSYELSHEHLPKIYSSFFSKSLVSNISTKHGSLFIDKNNPDLSSGLQALVCANKIMKINVPLTIIGTSGSSNGSNSSARESNTLYNNSVGVLVPHHLMSGFYSNAFTTELSILNTYCILRDKLNLFDFDINFSVGLIRHLGQVSNINRLGVYSEIIDSNLFLPSESNTYHINEIMSDGFIAPVMRSPSPEFLSIKSTGFNAVFHVANLGVKDIFQASSVSLLMREMYLKSSNFLK